MGDDDGVTESQAAPFPTGNEAASCESIAARLKARGDAPSGLDQCPRCAGNRGAEYDGADDLSEPEGNAFAGLVFLAIGCSLGAGVVLALVFICVLLWKAIQWAAALPT